MKAIILLVCIYGAAVLGGCGGDRFTVNFQQREVSISTEPGGATVYQVNVLTNARTRLGATPLVNQRVMIPVAIKGTTDPARFQYIGSQTQMLHVIIEKEGYKTYESNLATKVGQCLTHNITLERQDDQGS